MSRYTDKMLLLRQKADAIHLSKDFKKRMSLRQKADAVHLSKDFKKMSLRQKRGCCPSIKGYQEEDVTKAKKGMLSINQRMSRRGCH